MKYELYEVGGKIRDELLGLTSNDVDYSVVVVGAEYSHKIIETEFEDFCFQIEKEGFKIHVAYPETLTVKAKFPDSHKYSGDADFVIARKEIGYIKGTRQPEVRLGTLMDDLGRRDFTVNAMAKGIEGNIIDPFGGQVDLMKGLLRTPEHAAASFNDDPLRILRAFRFAVTKNLSFSEGLVDAIKLFQADKMDVVSIERIQSELTKMFKHSTSLSWTYLRWLEDINPALFKSLFRDGLWLIPTTKR